MFFYQVWKWENILLRKKLSESEYEYEFESEYCRVLFKECIKEVYKESKKGKMFKDQVQK